jgi:hypothetical protein
MKLDFGIHKGKNLEDIDDDSYLQWLGKPVYSGKFYVSLHVTDLKWKVPFTVTVAARKVLFKRGYTIIGERWEKKDDM